MRKIILFIACVLGVSASAQSVRMRDVFAAMPDSLMPLVTKNNRLDCIDFIENNMEAKARNRADEFVELKKLTEDYLLFETSPMSRVEMKLLTMDDSTQVVCMVRTYMAPGADSQVELFTAQWERVDKELAARFVTARPEVEAFFAGRDQKDEAVRSAVLMLRDLPLMEARLSADAPTLTWTIGLGELPKDEKKAAQKIVQPIRQSLLR